MQSPDLIVEPESVSSARPGSQKLVCIETDTSELLKNGKSIILDPESIHGYVGEFMHSFVVYGDIEPKMLRVHDFEEVKNRAKTDHLHQN